MNESTPQLKSAVASVVAEIQRLRLNRTGSIVVAIDGRSGAGKSTLASLVAEAVGATSVSCDDFFAANVSASEWDARSPAQKASDALDWRRLRTQAIEPLRAGKPARWFAFDFVAGPGPDGTYPMQRVATHRTPSAIIILDGAYSARPELVDLIDLAVLVEAPTQLRNDRLAARENPQTLEAWHTRWNAAEEYYFTQVRPPSTYRLTVTTSDTGTKVTHPA